MTEPGRTAAGPTSLTARAHRLVGPLLFAALLAGCAATPQTRSLLDDRPAELPPRAELERVPFFAQERYQCGPAALAMVLQDQGRPDTPEALVDEVYVPARQGTLRTEIRAAVRDRGLVPFPLQPELNAVLREVAGGRPVLVMQNLLFDWFPQWHFAVVVGYDLDEGDMILRSGTLRRRVTPMPVFERTWARSGHWAQVIVPPEELPATAEPLRWLRAVNELEQTGKGSAAMTGYRTATAHWPGSIEAWLARGNAAWAADDIDAARAAFTEAVLRAPERSAGWNNLAYTLAADNCRIAARAAAQCAAALAPDDPGPRDTLEEIGSMTGSGSGDRCELPACPVDTSGVDQ